MKSEMLMNKSVSDYLVGGRHLNYLDGWRGIAIALLLIGHFFSSSYIRLATAGVHLFFVLSGLLMARQLFLHKTPLLTFYKRRISRIFPTLYVFIISMVIFYGATGQPISWETVLGATALIRNYYPEGLDNKLPFDHVWSLSVEEHSYILLSIIAFSLAGKFKAQRMALGILSCGCILMGIRYTFELSGFELYSTRLIRTEVAAFGILCSGFLLLCFNKGVNRKISPWVFFALTIISIYSHTRVPYIVTVIVGVGSLALMINLLHQAPPWMLRVLSFSLFRKLGLWSYSLYLWQQPFFYLKNIGALSASVALVLAVLVGILSYFLIESPARNYLNKTWAKKATSTGNTAFLTKKTIDE